MRLPNETPTVQLLEPIVTAKDAHIFIGRVSEALRICGADEAFISEYLDKVISGDYESFDHFLKISNEYVDIV